MKIFISHSSKDKTFVDQFVEKILILGCGIAESEIFCSSIEGLGIKTGLDFRNHIKDTLLKSHYVLLLISNNYKKSDICLNEMGASWVQDSVEVMPFIFPDIDFNSVGTIYSVKQVAKISDPSSLDELFEELTNRYEIQKKVSRWNKSKGDFLNFISLYRQDNIGSQPEFNFFEQFIQKNVNLKSMLLKCHPNLLDCMKVFSEANYSKYFKAYCEWFVLIKNSPDKSLYENYKSFRVTKIDSMNTEKLTGGMKGLISKGVFNYNIAFYKVEFLETEHSRLGLSYNYFCYLDDRWVFFPKPWRLDNVR